VTASTHAGAAAAIFDVDGTIADTRSTTSLVWLRRQQHSTPRHALWLSSLAWRIPRLWLTHWISRDGDAADRQVFRQFAGLSRERVAVDARRCCEEVLLPACFPGALAEMDAHRAAGRRVVLLSAGIDVVLAPLAEALGAELLAQRLVAIGDRFTGAYRSYAQLRDDEAAMGQAGRKAAVLARYAAETGIDLRASCAYGDSVNDLAMLEIVGMPIVVRPDPRLARIAGARGWDVRRWGR
jgi:HAD superfamily hydrolase (TIGR01490 family)